MKTELELASTPKRKSFESEVEKTKERAFERSYKQASKEIAQAEGAAAGAAAASGGNQGASDPIVEAARQRALAPQQPAALNPRAGAKVQPTQPSGRFIETPEGRVPEEFYNLSPEQQKQFRALVKEEESAAESESLALQYSKSVGDQQEAQAQRITALESQLGAALSAMEAMNRRMRTIDTSVEVGKSDELIDAQSDIAQQVTNLAAVKAEAESAAASIRRETEIQRLDHDARIAALERPVAELEGRVKSSVVLMGERSNAVISALGESESRQQKVSVQLVELENRSDALGSPITRPEMKAMVTTEVTAEVKAQAPELIDQQIRDDKELGVINPGGQTMDRAYMQQKRSDAQAFRANATRGLG